jgi:hypothetical protein
MSVPTNLPAKPIPVCCRTKPAPRSGPEVSTNSTDSVEVPKSPKPPTGLQVYTTTDDVLFEKFKRIKFHNCSYFIKPVYKQTQFDELRQYEAWRILHNGTYYKVPVHSSAFDHSFGSLPICNLCKHQLHCLNNGNPKGFGRNSVANPTLLDQ